MFGNKKNTVNETEVDKPVLRGNSDNFLRSESYKVVRTNIMFSLPKTDKGKVIGVMSSVPNEGKTTNSINLALTFSQTGAKVILVDCDLRKPRVHRYLKRDLGVGVSNYVCGYAEFDEILNKNVHANLDLITAGEYTMNPVEILTSDRFRELVEQLATSYDFVFIDTPPVSVVTDAVVIAQYCSGVVVVTKAEYTTTDVLDYTIENLRKADSKLLGFILTNVQDKRRPYRYDLYQKQYYNS